MTNAKSHTVSGSEPVSTPLHAYETKAQVARRLGVSERTISNLMRDRRIPYVKLGRKLVRFPREEVDLHFKRNFASLAHGGMEGEQ